MQNCRSREQVSATVTSDERSKGSWEYKHPQRQQLQQTAPPSSHTLMHTADLHN